MPDRTPAETLRAAVAVLRCKHSHAVEESATGVWAFGSCTVCNTPREVARRAAELVGQELREPLADLLDLGPQMLAAFPDLARPHVDGEPCEDLACQMLAKLRAVAAVILGEAT
jgi:hypothetical protein